MRRRFKLLLLPMNKSKRNAWHKHLKADRKAKEKRQAPAKSAK
jgi:hypothetical protein